MIRQPVTAENTCEWAVHRFITEGSTLGISPGVHAPRSLTTTLGNQQPFVLQPCPRGEEESLLGYYRQSMGCIDLKVMND